jgi:hypothetical protein
VARTKAQRLFYRRSFSGERRAKCPIAVINVNTDKIVNAFLGMRIPPEILSQLTRPAGTFGAAGDGCELPRAHGALGSFSKYR